MMNLDARFATSRDSRSNGPSLVICESIHALSAFSVAKTPRGLAGRPRPHLPV